MPSSFKKRVKNISAIFLVFTLFIQINATAQTLGFLSDADQSTGLFSSTVRSLQIDEAGSVWVGTDNGLNILNSNTITQQKIVSTLINKSIWGFALYDSLAFVGTRYDGFYIINKNTGNTQKHFLPNIINQIRKVKVLNNRIFILSNEGIYELQKNSLIKISLTKNIKDDFATDLFYWKTQYYALSYNGFKVLKLGGDGFEEDCTKLFLPASQRTSLMCVQVKDDVIVIGGDGFYMVKKNNDAPKIFLLPKYEDDSYVVWDIAFVKDKIFLAIGDRGLNQKGFLHIVGTPFLKNQKNTIGYLTALAYDEKKNALYYGDLNNGMFLQQSISNTSAIYQSNTSKIIANEKYNFVYEGNIIKNLDPSIQNIKIFTEGKINAAKLFGDTLAIAFKKSISLYNAKNLVQLKTISASFEGITNIELLDNKLYLFYSYNIDMNYWDLIKNKIEHNDAIINSIPITENKYGKIIFLNKEKGFSVIEKDKSYNLNADDKTIAFISSFCVLGDNVYTLNKMTLKTFKIDFIDKKITSKKNIDLENIMEGFSPKWIYSNRGNLFLVSEKGIVEFEIKTGEPKRFQYVGNYPTIEKPLLINDCLWYSNNALLTKFPLNNFDNRVSLDSSKISLQYPKTVNENLPFSITVLYPDYQIQKYYLKCIQIKENGKLIYKRYTVNEQFNFSKGLPYGDYDVYVTIGNSTIKRDLNISLPLNRNPYFFGMIAFSILALSGLWLKSYLDKKMLNKKLMQNRLQVLKQNLNPHFVFNSMNLISSLILEKNYDKAIEVVADFSNLQRVYLETNNKEAITLHEELAFLNAYLKLQQTRFHYDNDFMYDIIVADEVDTNNILLPPLILQPLAENAIKYGVVGSSATLKKISIKIYGNNPTIILIQDNGKDVQHNYKGIGLGHKLVQERIALFNKGNKSKVSILFGMKLDVEGYGVELSVDK